MISTRRLLTLSAGLLGLAIAFGLDATPAQAQLMAPPYSYSVGPRQYTTVYPRTYAYNRGVLPGFSTRGGIGTTPYLGNTRGLGGYSYNYSRPSQTYSTPNYGRRMYRRWR